MCSSLDLPNVICLLVTSKRNLCVLSCSRGSRSLVFRLRLQYCSNILDPDPTPVSFAKLENSTPVQNPKTIYANKNHIFATCVDK